MTCCVRMVWRCDRGRATHSWSCAAAERHRRPRRWHPPAASKEGSWTRGRPRRCRASSLPSSGWLEKRHPTPADRSRCPVFQHQREATTISRFLETRAGTSTARRTELVDGSAWMRSGHTRAVWSGSRGSSVESGVRVAHSTLTDRVTATPWLLGVWPVASSWSVRAGASLVAQEPDVEHVIGTFGRPDVRAERARDLDAAIEYRPAANVRWRIAAYDRRERNVLRLEDAENRMVDGRLVFASSLVPSWRNALTGSARGVELLVQRRDPTRLNGWIGYSYGRIRYDDPARGEAYWGDFDQRHTLSAYGQFRLSPRTSVAAKLRYGSNFPIAGYFEERPTGLFVGRSRNAVRLPPYSRLDVRADRAFNYGSRRLTLFVEVINVFNRTNSAQTNGVVGVTSRAFEYTSTMFPMLPTAGVRFDF
jgi:TonB dependent receptor